MSQWKTDDSAGNSVLWAVSGFGKTANSANRDDLFGNTTADAYVTGQTIGMYGVDPAEVVYEQWELFGVAPASNSGDGFILTSNSTTGLLVNGGTSSVSAQIDVDTLTVGTVAINAAGQAYTNGDIVEIAESGTGDHARYVVTANGTGNVTAVTPVAGFPGNYTVFPSAAANTANVSGSGNSLVLDVTAGAGQLSISNGGLFTVLPTTTEDVVANTEANQTGSGVKVNYYFKRVTPDVTPGWVLVREGSGNKAGRKTTETLVTVRSMSGDAEDTMFPNT